MCQERQLLRRRLHSTPFPPPGHAGGWSTEPEWTERAKRFVKAELKRADVTYEELAGRLREMGLEETKVSIASKLSGGGFGATFFIATMKAIGRATATIIQNMTHP